VLVAVSAPASAQARVDPDEFTARAIARLAIFDLRLSDEPTAEDHELAWHMLGLAERLAPQDEQYARLRMEAAFSAGDPDALFEQTRRVLALDPDDEISLLRLLTSRITRAQTAEERLAIYDRLLGQQGIDAGLSPAIRSRLALDAALLMREQGNLDGFAERLEQAVTLDSTNKEAAALTLSFYAENIDDPIGRLDLLSNLLHADPVDPNVHDSIMRELASAGAFRGAKRFHTNEIQILQAAGRQPDESLTTAGLVIDWHINGPQNMVAALNHSLQIQRDQAQRNIELLKRQREPTNDVTLPDEIRLPAFLDVARVVGADATGDRATVEDAMTNLARTAKDQADALHDPEVVGPDADPEQVNLAIIQMLSRVTMVRLWTGAQLDDAAKGLEALEGSGLIDEDTIAVYKGWLAYRRGDVPTAMALLEPLAPLNPFADVGLALARIESGLEAEGIETLARVARQHVLTLMGAWAHSRYEAITGQTLVMSENADRLESWARAVPAWLDRMAVQPERFLTLEVEPVDASLDPLARQLLRIRIRNTSTIPLAFGPGRPISSRILVVPRLDVGLEVALPFVQPEFFDISRRLRLMPRETFDVVIWPDPGRTGYFVDLALGSAVRTRWRVVQGYTLDQQGLFEAGPMAVTAETRSITLRLPLAETDHAIGELARRIRTDEEASLPPLIAALRTRIHEYLIRGVDDQTTNPIPAIAAAAERYPECSPRTRLLMGAVLQTEQFFPPMKMLRDRIVADEDPDVRMLALFARVADPADELLAESLQSPNAEVARVAYLVQERLEAERGTFSKMRPVRRQAAPQGR
jgi:hypothetical protein